MATIGVVIPTALVADPTGQHWVVSCLASLIPAAAVAQAGVGGARLAEVVLVTQGRPLVHPIVDTLAAAGVAVHQHDVIGSFNFSKKVNAGAALVTSDVLFLLNDDARLTGPDWPVAITGILSDARVGAVGPIIRNPDGTLNSAGDALSIRGPRHVDAFDVRYRPALARELRADREVSLITGAAVAMRTDMFKSVGGFDERFPSSYGDVDFCLRLRSAGFRLVSTPRATVVHHESSSRDPRVSHDVLELLLVDRPDLLREDPLLPPLALPLRLRVARRFGPVVRSIYRATVRRLLPASTRERLTRAVIRRGWIV